MSPVRRHLLFLLDGFVAERLQALRIEWDPVMASRTPPHVSVAYPEEVTDESMLVERAALAAADTEPSIISLGRLVAEEKGRSGVWFAVVDPSDTWNQLRSSILRPPFQPIPIEPHATVVHPRTSPHGPEAFVELAETRIDGDLRLSEMVFTETSDSGMRILNRFPLTASSRVRVVAGLLRADGRVLRCHRRHDRTHYPNVWNLPGGHIEEGEFGIDALVRELTEELGIVPELAESSPWLTLTADGLELDVFVVDRWRGEPHNVAVEEHDEIRWVTAAELADLDLAHPSYLQILSRALA